MPTASYIHGIYIDEVLSMRRADGSGVVRDFYYHQDDLFNVTMVTDASGAAVERYEYGDYGAPRFFDGGGAAISASALGAARLFNGREWDAEVAMYYYRTRYLEPSLGRFLQRDIIDIWGDMANYGGGSIYTACNPYSLLDPLGLLPGWVADTILFVTGGSGFIPLFDDPTVNAQVSQTFADISIVTGTLPLLIATGGLLAAEITAGGGVAIVGGGVLEGAVVTEAGVVVAGAEAAAIAASSKGGGASSHHRENGQKYIRYLYRK